MEAAIQLVKDSAITLAIRDIKRILKELAIEQKTGKRQFRSSMSKWSKLSYEEMVGMLVYPPTWSDKSMMVTSLHIIYNKLRETNRSHLNESEYFDGPIGRYLGRRSEYNNQLKWLKITHPIAASRLGV